MAIVRVQSAQNFLSSGTTLQVTLPSTPVGGNTLILFVGQNNGFSSDPTIVTSISQFGATWQRISQSVYTFEQTLEVWIAQGIDGITNSTAIINLLNSSQTVVALFEYSGLVQVGSPVDRIGEHTGITWYNQAWISANLQTSKENELWIGGVLLRGGNNVASNPTNGFAKIAEVSTDPLSSWAYDRSMAVFEKIVSSVGVASSTITTFYSFGPFASSMITLTEAGFSTVEKTVGLNMMLVDEYEKTVDLSSGIAATRSVVSGMNAGIHVEGLTEQVGLDALIWTPGHLFNGLDVSIFGTNDQHQVSLDAYVIGTVFCTVGLDIFKSFRRTKYSNLNVAIRGVPTLQVKMNVGVLVIPDEIDNTTTPQGSAYRDCRPVWCALPKMKTVSSSMDLRISPALYPQMDLNIS